VRRSPRWFSALRGRVVAGTSRRTYRQSSERSSPERGATAIPAVRLQLALTAILVALLSGCADSTRTAAPAALGASPDFPSGRSAARLPETVATVREPWSFGDAPGELIRTPHYDIRTTITYERLLDRMPLFLERSLANYAMALAELPMPNRPMETYVFRNRHEWWEKTTELLPQQATELRNLGRGGFASRGIAVLYYIDWSGRSQDTFAIAAHEGWHQYTQRMLRHPLPIWLEEGIATYMEGYRTIDDLPVFEPHWNAERRRELAEAIERGRLIPLADLLDNTPQAFLAESKDRLLTYYAQVWALTLFLAEGAEGSYATALSDVLEDAAAGRLITRVTSSPTVVEAGGRMKALTTRTGPWVILTYFSQNIPAFETAYLNYVHELARGQR